MKYNLVKSTLGKICNNKTYGHSQFITRSSSPTCIAIFFEYKTTFYLLFFILFLFYFFIFRKKKVVNLFLQHFKENMLKKHLLTQHLNITNVLLMFFTFQIIISSLFSAFREIIGNIFPLHTHTDFHLL